MASRVYTLGGEKRGLKLDAEADIAPYLAELEAIDQLEEIHLGGNTLGVEACRALARVLETKKSLKVCVSPGDSISHMHSFTNSHWQVADFADIFTGRLISEIPQSLKALCDALISHPNLIQLDLSDNAFGGRVAEPMVDFLVQNTSYEILRLSNNGLGPAGGQVVAGALLHSAQKAKEEGRSSKLRVLVCGRNRLENGSADAWAEAFKAHGTLREVRMYQNGIRQEGIAALVRALRSNPQLETLDLQDNTAVVQGSRVIAASLASWPNLRSLNLSDCLLRPRGALAIADALGRGHNPRLEELKLQSDELDARTVHSLARAVENHLSSLAVVEINGNRVDADDESVVELREALEKRGHADAIDEIDDVEEVDEDEEEEEEQEEEEEEEAVVVVAGATAGEDVRAAEPPVVLADKLEENLSEPKPDQDKDVDSLADLLQSKAKIDK
jgi:Ran GTPase-activating protein 1